MLPSGVLVGEGSVLWFRVLSGSVGVLVGWLLVVAAVRPLVGFVRVKVLSFSTRCVWLVHL